MQVLPSSCAGPSCGPGVSSQFCKHRSLNAGTPVLGRVVLWPNENGLTACRFRGHVRKLSSWHHLWIASHCGWNPCALTPDWVHLGCLGPMSCVFLAGPLWVVGGDTKPLCEVAGCVLLGLFLLVLGRRGIKRHPSEALQSRFERRGNKQRKRGRNKENLSQTGLRAETCPAPSPGVKTSCSCHLLPWTPDAPARLGGQPIRAT